MAPAAAQVALKWLLDQDGVGAIPKASRRESQQANLDALKIGLDDDDRKKIAGLPKNKRFVDPGFSPAWDCSIEDLSLGMASSEARNRGVFKESTRLASDELPPSQGGGVPRRVAVRLYKHASEWPLAGPLPCRPWFLSSGRAP